MNNQRLLILYNKAITNTITLKERDELFDLMLDIKNKKQLDTLFADTWQNSNLNNPIFSKERGSAILKRILDNGELSVVKKKRTRTLMGKTIKFAAAAIVLLVSAVAFYLYNQETNSVSLAHSIAKSNILPGKNVAILTLGDGRKVLLDDTEGDLLARESGVNIRKLPNGQIYYQKDNESTDTSPPRYNSIVTPRGGHFTFMLPDGTTVHLNSESSIKYPSQFTDKDRKVELIGEAYFKVKHNRSQPFYVKTGNQITMVLGTIFNISAYKEMNTIKTTLVEGSVMVSKTEGKSIILTPGQMALNDKATAEFIVEKADLDEELAWHNGYFIFNYASIEDIMQTISRWYDIEVEYQGKMNRKRFSGIFQRSNSIEKLLNSFKQSGIIDFQISGRRVIVTDK